jgi:hypothetical protein
MFAFISTAWCVFWLVSLIIVGSQPQNVGMPILTAWFIIGWLPPIFYKLMATEW